MKYFNNLSNLIIFFTNCLVTIVLFNSNIFAKTNETSNKKLNMEKSHIDKIKRVLLDRTKIGKNFNSTKEFERIDRCVELTIKLWDGSETEFTEFIETNFITDSIQLEKLFDRISYNFEVINGSNNEISLILKKPTQLNTSNHEYLGMVDDILSSYESSSHFSNDMFSNKLAYLITLNFPSYNLAEKLEKSKTWSKRDWAKARLGDYFTMKVDASINQKVSKAQTDADNYISNYYIFMGNIVNNDNVSLFPENMKLISHWNLRDELKSNYAKPNGLEKQRLLYSVMNNIIKQEIPQAIINSPEYKWNPITNEVYSKDLSLITDVNIIRNEENIRYSHILNNFEAIKEADKIYNENYIKRKFDGEYEISQTEMEKLFINYLSSPVIKDVAKLIKNRLGRNLEPFDIWYDGFKSRGSINEEELDKITKKLYPNSDAVQKDLFNILMKLGFDETKSKFIASKVIVEPSKGAGHAWGAQAKWQNSYLRTRIESDGMDYKGYNIAVHEFGHNVEQTFSLHNVPEYLIAGVPNNAFTEAIAFLFQLKDLELLGLESDDINRVNLYVLDNFWNTYEIMGAALVDQYVWKWLYENPNANKEELNIAVNRIAKEVWNKYYAEIFGIKDQNILAVYSHSIDYPLYLSAYPLGHLIEFQLTDHINKKISAEKDNNLKKKIFANEVERFSSIGKLLPNIWMNEAVGSNISGEPLINAAKNAVSKIK